MDKIEKARIIYSDGLNFKAIDSNLEKKFLTRTKGKFKINSIFPVVGDFVDIEVNDKDNHSNLNTISKIYPRKNIFMRPAVSNIDGVIIVVSLKEPDFDLYLLLKQITMFQSRSIEIYIFFNKYDLLTEKEKEIHEQVAKFFNDRDYSTLTFGISSKEDQIEKLSNTVFSDKFITILGQSGAGKSTIINSFNKIYKTNYISIKTQLISKKLNRGKHTTRHFEAFKFEKFFIIDTPGFSSFETDLSQIQIANNFLDFFQYSNLCKFSNCKHINEPKCNVKDIYEFSNNPFNREIYDIYKKIFTSI